MKCQKCGELIEGFAIRCPVCGASLTKDDNDLQSFSPKTMVNPTHTHWEDCSSDAHPGAEGAYTGFRSEIPVSQHVGFAEAVRLFFVRFADFRGRSRRSEYWWPTLLIFVLNLVLSSITPELGSLLTVVLFVPCLALCIRRLHDVGKSGWWYLLIFIPFGALVLLYFFCKDSAPRNQWGTSPKY